MIKTLLRLPEGAGEVLADLVRIAGLLSIIAAAIWWGVQDAAIFALVLLGLLVPRFIGVRPAVDASFGVILLVAGWSGVLSLYASVPGWDVVVHFCMNGATAAIMYLLLARLRIVPRVQDPQLSYGALIVLTAIFGLAFGALWEITEWLGHTFINSSIFVAYEDTIGDLAAGAFGSLVAGFIMKALPPQKEAAPVGRSGELVGSRSRD